MIEEASGISWPFPPDEASRLADLHAFDVLDTPSEQPFDGITEIAAALFEVPFAVLGFVDEDRHWFKAKFGTELNQTCRSIAFCRYTIMSTQTHIVEDLAVDPRFYDHPLVVGEPHVRFYAGAPLVSYSGQCIGTLCLLDVQPRRLTMDQTRLLEQLTSQTVEILESRRLVRRIAESLPQAVVPAEAFSAEPGGEDPPHHRK